MKLLRQFAFVLTFAFVATSFADSNRESIQARYNAISRLTTKKQKTQLAKTIRKNSTSNFEFLDRMDNSLDVEATIRQNNEQLDQVIKFSANTNRIIGVKQVGGDLICTVKTSYDAIANDGGKKARIQGVSISEDTWTKTLLGWKMRRSKAIKESVTKNGKALKV